MDSYRTNGSPHRRRETKAPRTRIRNGAQSVAERLVFVLHIVLERILVEVVARVERQFVDIEVVRCGCRTSGRNLNLFVSPPKSTNLILPVPTGNRLDRKRKHRTPCYRVIDIDRWSSFVQNSFAMVPG